MHMQSQNDQGKILMWIKQNARQSQRPQLPQVKIGRQYNHTSKQWQIQYAISYYVHQELGNNVESVSSNLYT